jgi:hypothetical protein
MKGAVWPQVVLQDGVLDRLAASITGRADTKAHSPDQSVEVHPMVMSSVWWVRESPKRRVASAMKS